MGDDIRVEKKPYFPKKIGVEVDERFAVKALFLRILAIFHLPVPHKCHAKYRII